MPRGGWNRKPTALKVLEGNPGKRPLNQNEPKPKPIAPKCPSWLDREAKKLWKQLADQLEKLGLLTEVDGPMFAALCAAYSRWRRAMETLRDMDPADPAFRKVSVTAEKALAEMRMLAAEFGLTPAARGRLSLPEATVDDDFDDFLAGRL